VAIPAALLVATVPSWVNKVQTGHLTEKDKLFLQKLQTLQPYSATETEAFQRHAQGLVQRFKTEGDGWLRQHEAVRYFLSDAYHPDRTAAQREVAFSSLKNQIILESVFAANGMEVHRLMDMDGTQAFKDFFNVICHGEYSVVDKQRLAHVLPIFFALKQRAVLQEGFNGQGLAQASLPALLNDLVDTGFFKAKELTPEQLKTTLRVWGENAEKSFQTMSQEELDYYLKRNIESANTARAGFQDNTNNEAIAPNHITGASVVKNKQGMRDRYEPRAQVSFMTLLGLDRNPTNELIYKLKINGYEGTVAEDGQVFHSQNAMDVALSGLHQTIVDAGLYDKVFNNKDGIYYRIAEFKGNLTQHPKELLLEHYQHRIAKMEADNSNYLTEVKAGAKLSNEQWQALSPAKKAQVLNSFELQHANRPNMGLPQAWELAWSDVATRALYEAELLHQQGKSVAPVWQKLLQRTRPLSEADHAFFELPQLVVRRGADGTTRVLKNPERLAQVEAYTQAAQQPQFQVPMAAKHRQLIEQGLAANKGVEGIRDLIQQVNTVDFGCFTVHSIESELRGVYGFIEEQRKLGKTPAKSVEATVLESDKWKLLSWILELEKDPAVQQAIADRGFDCLLRIDSNSKELRFNTDKEKAMINMVNNSSSYKTHEIYPGLTAQYAKQHGYSVQFDPTASYVESVFGARIDKGAVTALNELKLLTEHMAGDSMGTDLSTIAWLATKGPLHSSEVVRGMIDQPNLFNAVIQALDVGPNSTAAKLEKSYRKAYQRHGLPAEAIDALMKQYWDQVYSNPFRYKKNEQGQLTLVGHGHAEVLASLGHTQNTFSEDGFRALYQKVHKDVNLPKVYFAEDVFQKILRDALARGFVHNQIDQVSRLVKHSSLAGEALDVLPGFKNRNAFSLGMPFHASFTPKNWQPPLHTTGRNVYHPVHKLLQSISPAALKGSSAGGLLALGGGLVAAVVTSLQLKEHAQHKHLLEGTNTPDDDPMAPVLGDISIGNVPVQRMGTQRAHTLSQPKPWEATA
jgi:hypothetical protein